MCSDMGKRNAVTAAAHNLARRSYTMLNKGYAEFVPTLFPARSINLKSSRSCCASRSMNDLVQQYCPSRSIEVVVTGRYRLRFHSNAPQV
jgi:hypothetical protein